MPGRQGELVSWLERFLVNHGAVPWSVLEATLQAEDGPLDQARRLTSSLYGEEEPQFEDLQHVLRQLQIDALSKQIQALIASNPQGEQLREIARLRQEIDQLKKAMLVSSG
ncbi:hypothetical protein [Paucibacter sp. XJ19-41]|uniref:hypothetical protein n=1 Tax=Paucibacter sp. XJ19-41 TaxID=2927824 RepID=UPI002349D5F6|nr:hypothetical protein [Paucibacter sp. XJ19-41]MDC6167222.1 hypothetical protein [Paucibacter sp. XJ19-41]